MRVSLLNDLPKNILLKALWGGHTAAFEFSTGHTAAGWTKKVGDAQSATGGSTTSRAGNTFAKRMRKAMATAGSKFVTQNKINYKKHVCRVLQARRRQQIAHEIKNWRCDACSRLCRRGLGGKMCTGLEPQAFFEGGLERTKSEPTEQRSDKSQQRW